MTKHLVIVESPAKAKTIKKYLGNDYEILASYGHVRDLLPKEGSVDTNNNFAMRYEVIERNERHVSAIAKALKTADTLLIATDPDREGEAIAWHIYQLMLERKALKDKPVHRVVFHEITKQAIIHAVEHPREIAMDLVNAQQARRALDYLVGFKLSPLLWKKIRRGLSAGRVQSPALRLIVERELEIEQFQKQEYWTLIAHCEAKAQPFSARLVEYQQQKVEQFTVTTATQAEQIRDELLAAAKGHLTVNTIDKKQRKRYPAAPFITSTLQQEAARKLGFTAKKTMMVAQQLYEGIDIGTGSVGLITYMRTDSVSLANDAISEIREYIKKKYGVDNLPESPRVYKTKAKNAQEAHEAVRPTSVTRTPTLVKEHLTPDQFKLYDLVWKRTVACQMIHATIDTVAIDLSASADHRFRANGSTIAFPGFMAVYLEGKDEAVDDDEERLLPPMKVGDVVDLTRLAADQHFTEPPPRYSEASLVKALEEFGIGRPSTYASIISTLQQREYVILDKKRFMPTDVGRIVIRFLTQHFTRYVDYDFTAQLEDELDAVSRGEKEWVPVLTEFWQPFVRLLTEIDETVQRKDVTTELIEERCPKCDKQLTIRLGKRGRFVGCSGYPECDYTSNVGEPAAPVELEVVPDRQCPKCQGNLVFRNGPYGKFIGCSNYPTCKHLEPLEKPADTGVTCPECHKGVIVQRKSRRGKVFYSCDKYPTCKYALWDEPLNEPCPQCSWPILTIKNTKRGGDEKRCPKQECGYKEPVGGEKD
jgi:DNA topoisomerase-1